MAQYFRSSEQFRSPSKFEKDLKKINGLTEYTLSLRENFKPGETTMLELNPTSDGGTRLNFTGNFKPGCVIAVKYVLASVNFVINLQKVASKKKKVDFY